MGLTDKQRRFCEEYLKDHCPSGAARRAGYRGKSAGWRLLRIDAVLQHMEELKEVKAGRYLDFLVEGLKDVAEDLTTALSTSGEGVAGVERSGAQDFLVLDEYSVAASTTPAAKGGHPSSERRGIAKNVDSRGIINTKDRLKALELLGKYLGVFKQKKKVPVKRVPEEYQIIFIERSDGNDNDGQK